MLPSPQYNNNKDNKENKMDIAEMFGKTLAFGAGIRKQQPVEEPAEPPAEEQKQTNKETQQ